MKLIITFIFLVTVQFTIGQQPEYEKHINSIRKIECNRGGSHCEVTDSTFLDYAINNIIPPSEVKYISNRRLLKSLNINDCSKWYVEMNDSVNNKSIKVVIKAYEFDTTNSVIEKYTEPNYSHINKSINGLTPYGSRYGFPKMEWTELNILVDGKALTIPDSAFKNLYEPNFCEFIGFTRNIRVYSSLDGNYLYLYVYGGNAADSYFAKLIFDHEKFIAKWVVDYYPLSCYGCFHDQFIGF